MIESSISRRARIATVVCFVYLILTIFYHHIDKYLTGILFTVLFLLIPVTFVFIAVLAFRGVAQIVRNRKHLTLKLCWPAIITLMTLCYTLFSPYRLDSENLESKVVWRACFEGTQNQAFILFRDDNSFELNWTGVFFADEWFYGNYKQNGDTVYLEYHTKQPYRFGDTLLIQGESLTTISKINKRDSTRVFVPFYLGYCKGLN